eukprot:TRINITY_DN19934_c0_g1_i1.p1 TRINITY_DN19934_c0_g1~~TRINITY_DN19934_c0_g1_i1.p1  ORF type:complete len:288 (+),score=26.32 TRINITY_DN19934_c0_g1_i1:40-903(+)
MHGLLLVVLLFLTQLLAAPVYYAKWSPTPTTENGETKYQGTINVNGVTVEVKFYASMPLQGISTGDGMDYWGPQLDFYGTSTPSPLPSAYLSSYVDDLPPASHIIRISHAQMNYFEFSQPVSGAVLAVARLSANSYLFDTDFTVYSSGDGTTNAPGYWGAGTLLREATPYGKYSLSGAGEAHGVVGFEGTFSSLFFQSTAEENWNGFNIGVFGVAPAPVVAVLTEVGSGADGGGGVGFSGGEVVAICVGAVVGTLLLIGAVSFVVYTAFYKGTNSEDMEENSGYQLK